MMGPLLSRSNRTRLLAATMLSAAFVITSAQQPAPTTSAGCGVLKDVTTCNWPGFKAALNAAHTIAIDPSQIDRPTIRQLTELATKLGKSIATPDQPPDLTFSITPIGNNGISIGPGEQRILKLQIFSGPASSGTLLWVETLTGEPDRPWPSSVHAVIDQFQTRLK